MPALLPEAWNSFVFEKCGGIAAVTVNNMTVVESDEVAPELPEEQAFAGFCASAETRLRNYKLTSRPTAVKSEPQDGQNRCSSSTRAS